MKTQTRLVNLITLVALLGFMFAAVSCTGPTADKYTAATGITPGQTASLAGNWWLDYEQAKAATDVIQATKASPVTSTKDVIDVRPVTSFVAPEASPPAPEPTEEQPKKRSRPSPRDPPQMIAATTLNP